MRSSLLILVCVLIAAGLAAADDEPAPPPKAAEDVTVAEREKELKRAAAARDASDRLHYAQKYDDAVKRRREALGIHERILGPDHPEVAQDLLRIAASLVYTVRRTEPGKAYSRGQDPVKDLIARAVSILERAFGAEHPKLAYPLAVRAMHHLVRVDYAMAWPDMERARGLLDAAPDSRTQDAAYALMWLGSCYYAFAYYQRARDMLERCIAILEERLPPESPWLMRAYKKLGNILVQQRQWDAAWVLTQRVVSVLERTLGPKNVNLATPLALQSEIALHRGDAREARRFARRALAVLGSSRTYSTSSQYQWRKLAMAELALGGHEAAFSAVERGCEAALKVMGPESPYYAVCLKDKASVLQALSRYGEAIECLHRAFVITADVTGNDNIYAAEARAQLASNHEAQGDLDTARSEMQLCLDVTERAIRRDLSVIQGQERLERVKEVHRHLGTWLTLATKLGETGYPDVLRFKGLVSRTEAADRRLRRRSGRTPEGLARIGALSEVERTLSLLARLRPAKGRKEAFAKWQAQYVPVAARRDELRREMGKAYAPMREGLERLEIGVSDVQASLPSGVVLLDTLRTSDRYLGWVVRPKGEVVRLDLGSVADVEEAAERFTELVSEESDLDTAEARNVVRRLHDLVLAPLEAHIGNDLRTLILCPDGALAAVPFSALRAAAGLHAHDYDLVHVAMAQDLVPWSDEAPPNSGAVLAGAPDYERAAEAPVQVRVEPASPVVASLPRAPRGKSFRPLPGAAAEVRFLSGIFGGSASVLLGPNATEARLRAEARGRKIVHIATHGFIRDDLIAHGVKREAKWLGAGAERQFAVGEDPMLLSGLAMAGANHGQGAYGDDGILTALEASHLDLDGVEMVVLSACETARGRAESGEGVIGLMQGFHMAGARNVLASLWKVDDAATKALMVKFYELWNPRGGKGLGAAAALRQAQQHVRDRTEVRWARTGWVAKIRFTKPWAHPYYWAAWVLWGLPD